MRPCILREAAARDNGGCGRVAVDNVVAEPILEGEQDIARVGSVAEVNEPVPRTVAEEGTRDERSDFVSQPSDASAAPAR